MQESNSTDNLKIVYLAKIMGLKAPLFFIKFLNYLIHLSSFIQRDNNSSSQKPTSNY